MEGAAVRKRALGPVPGPLWLEVCTIDRILVQRFVIVTDPNDALLAYSLLFPDPLVCCVLLCAHQPHQARLHIGTAVVLPRTTRVHPTQERGPN